MKKTIGSNVSFFERKSSENQGSKNDTTETTETIQ